jgi:hypothetical protein
LNYLDKAVKIITCCFNRRSCRRWEC